MVKALDAIHKSIMSLNNSKFFAGVIMILLNIGSKYITIELSKNQEQYLKHYVSRVLLIFAVVWMGTRDIYISIILTSSFLVMTQALFNEESKYCILPSYLKRFNDVLDRNDDTIISDQEIEHAIKVLEKARRVEEKRKQLQMLNTFK